MSVRPQVRANAVDVAFQPLAAAVDRHQHRPQRIASFAFNFNNFNVIYMLTDGGPRDANAPIPVGFTDLLITMVYKVAFTGQTRDYGLASAYSIIIFIIVAIISIIAFRRTKSLEELN